MQPSPEMTSFLTGDSQPSQSLQDAQMNLASPELQQKYDIEPFGLSHNLQNLDLFRFPSLVRLCEKFSASNHGYFVAASAPSSGADFYSVPYGGLKPDQAIERVKNESLRILLKRPEQQDPRFKELLNILFQQLLNAYKPLTQEDVLRLESAILITSGSTITPVHFDPVIGFFAQIEGVKMYHCTHQPTPRSRRWSAFTSMVPSTLGQSGWRNAMRYMNMCSA